MLKDKMTDAEMLKAYRAFAEQVSKAMSPEYRDMLNPENSMITISTALENLQGAVSLDDAMLRKPIPHLEPAKLWPVENLHMCLDAPMTGADLPARETYSLPPRIESDGSITGRISQPLAGATELMWNPGQDVRVKLMGGTPYFRLKVRQYAEEWMQHANIKFVFVDPSESAEIRIAFDPGGSWSSLGRDALGIPFNFATMNFGWFDENTTEDEFRRVILHEFGHALGLIHEHQSPVGGVQWDREKVYAYYQVTQGWDRATVDQNVFRKYEVSRTNYSQYDPTSVMHYPIPADLTLNGIGTPWNTTLSTIDQNTIRLWYPHPPSPANASGVLRTGDTCDEINFLVQYNAVASSDVEFNLSVATGIWWKAIEIPVGADSYRMLETQDSDKPAQVTLPVSDIDVTRPIRFWKAKAFGVHVRVNFVWDVLSVLPGGTRLSFTWKRDTC